MNVNIFAYEGAVLKALEESENALVAYDRTRLETEHLEQAAADLGRRNAVVGAHQLERFAAQQFYAPVRLLRDHAGIERVPLRGAAAPGHGRSVSASPSPRCWASSWAGAAPTGR